MTLNAKIGGFNEFFGPFRAATQVHIIHKVSPRNASDWPMYTRVGLHGSK